MKFRFTIGRKIALGFGIILILFLLSSLLTNLTLVESRKKTDKVTKIFNPSVAALKEMDNLLNRSKFLITKWFYFQSSDDIPEKNALRTLLKIEYPLLIDKIHKLSPDWNEDERKQIEEIISMINTMFSSYENDIMLPLNSFDSYQDRFSLEITFEDLNSPFVRISDRLKILIIKQNSNANDNTTEMLSSFSFLQQIVVWLGVILLIGGVLIAFYTIRSIVQPIQQLKRILLMMGRGVLPKDSIPNRNDEIGEMSIALNELVDGMARTTDFANEVGAGNFESDYKPLSDEDTLGAALLKMREDLSENERLLEAKVIERTEEVVRQKEEIENKNQELEVLYTHVTDSIKYAKRIQEAILPPADMMKKYLPNSFVLFKPKDIVSGDFYWLDTKDNKTLFAAVDCTGHGVPGAFMSIVGYNILKYVLSNNNFTEPALILDALNEGVSETLHHGHEASQAKDGMDLSFCTIDYNTLELQFAGAYNPLYIIRNKELIQIKADKFPIGYFLGDNKQKFTNHKMQLQKGDCVYIFSDGYSDQFGGPRGKKFMASNFRNLLLQIHQLPMENQKEILNKTIEDWRGVLDQVDDVLVIGLTIK